MTCCMMLTDVRLSGCSGADSAEHRQSGLWVLCPQHRPHLHSATPAWAACPGSPHCKFLMSCLVHFVSVWFLFVLHTVEGVCKCRMKVPSARIPEFLKVSLCQAQSWSDYSFTCFAYCQEFCLSYFCHPESFDYIFFLNLLPHKTLTHVMNSDHLLTI